jgi:hypothetical protein
MANDVFFAGVEPGGLYTAQEIKILLCYLLDTVGEPLPLQMVTDVLAGRGIANFFEVSAAVDELLRRGHIEENAEGELTVTELGHQTAQTLVGMVPITLRERSVQAALQLLTRRRREQENSVVIQPLDRGHRVTCSVNEGDRSIMSFSLVVGDELQAQMVKERFLDDPVTLYRGLIAILTGNVELEKNGNRIIAELP